MGVLSDKIQMANLGKPNLRFQATVVDAFAVEHLESLQNLFRDRVFWMVCTEDSILDTTHSEICAL